MRVCIRWNWLLLFKCKRWKRSSSTKLEDAPISYPYTKASFTYGEGKSEQCLRVGHMKSDSLKDYLFYPCKKWRKNILPAFHLPASFALLCLLNASVLHIEQKFWSVYYTNFLRLVSFSPFVLIFLMHFFPFLQLLLKEEQLFKCNKEK